MFHKILVALDHSAFSPQIFENSLAIAKAHQAHLILLHILSSDEKGSPGLEGMTGLSSYEMVELETLKTYQKKWQDYVNQGLETLKSYADQAEEAGVQAEYTQVSGKPGRKICEVAQSYHADLIMMGRRGFSGLSEFILGSVSNYVLHHAHCSVLIVQSTEHSQDLTS